MIDYFTGRDTLIVITDHDLRDGLQKEESIIAATDGELFENVESVLNVRAPIESELPDGTHQPEPDAPDSVVEPVESDAVAQQLEDLGYT